MRHLAFIALAAMVLAGCEDTTQPDGADSSQPMFSHGPPVNPGQPGDPGPPDNAGPPDDLEPPDDPGAPTFCIAPPSGLVSWWPGDGNADDIQDGNDGTLQNGVTFATGFVGQAFSFDGLDDKVEIPNSITGSLDITGNQITVDAWVNPSALVNPAGAFSAMVIVDNAFPDGYILQTGNGIPIFLVFTSAGSGGVAGPTALPINTFSHVAGTYDGIAVKLYVDGVLVVSRPHSGNILHNKFNVAIGHDNAFRAPSTLLFGWFGLLDEIEIFNRALSATEIQAIFNAGSAGKCKA